MPRHRSSTHAEKPLKSEGSPATVKVKSLTEVDTGVRGADEAESKMVRKVRDGGLRIPRKPSASASVGASTEASMPIGHYRKELVEPLAALLGEIPGVMRRVIFGHPGFWIQGRCFAAIFGTGVSLKFSRDRAAELANQPGFSPMVALGRKMGGWVILTHDDPQKYAQDLPLLLEAYAYVADEATPPPPMRSAWRG